jgi:DnaK suppressor protein
MPTKTTEGAKSAKSPRAAKPKNTEAPASVEAAPAEPQSQPAETAAPVAAVNGASTQAAGTRRADLDMEYFRNLLLQERTRLEEERDTIRASGLATDGALPEEGEGGDEDTADLASAMMDKEMDLAVEEELEDIMAAIDHALQKMDDGTYGVCDMSGQPIPRGRLELIPWASLTAECQAMAEGEG